MTRKDKVLQDYKLSEQGRLTLKDMEGFVATPYKDAVGKSTIGWGHLLTAIEEKEIASGKIKLIPEVFEYIFSLDVQKHELEVIKYINVKLTQYEFDALVLLCFNIGGSNFGKSSLVKVINAGKPYDPNVITTKFKMWNKGTVAGRKVELRGLTNRRIKEAQIFNDGYGT